MSAKVDTENEKFLDTLISLGFTIGTASLVLADISPNQALIRTIGSGTNFTLSNRQEQTLTNALIKSGLSEALATEVTQSVQRVELKNPPVIPEVESKTTSAFTNALIQGGISATFASIITTALSSDEEVLKLLGEKKRVVIYMTQRDNKVDDIICLPLEGNVYSIDAANRPRITLDTHPNCRCFYIDAVTGENLGQF